MLIKVPKCDVCGKLKGVGNRWMIGFVSQRVQGLGKCRVALFDWSDTLSRKRGAKHLCGEGCFSTLASRALEHRTRRMPIVEVEP
jgi:hypothetical protein